jgi:hypothetical protein
MRKNLLLVLPCVLALQAALAAQEPNPNKKVLKNSDIVMMAQNHFDDETLIKIIQVSQTDFDISSGALIDLKNQGVTSAVIRAMLQSAQDKLAQEQQKAASGAASTRSGADATSASGANPGFSNHASSTSPSNSAPAPAPAPAPNPSVMQDMPAMGISPQQMAAMQAQLSSMGMGGMMGGMGMGGMMGGMGSPFATQYSPEQLPHVYLMGITSNREKQEVAPSQAMIGQSKYKGSMGAGGMAMRSLATEGLSFAAMGAGPAGMMAMSAFSMASGFMPGMRPGAPSITYAWGLPGRKSARELTNTDPMFELSYGQIPGVDPDAYEPAVVKLYLTKDNYRLVGATRTKLDAKSIRNGGGPESGKWISEDRWPTRVDKEERGFYVMHVNTPLEPGEYAVVLRPVKGYKAEPSLFGGGAQVFYSVWDFSVPGATPEDSKKKKKKK